MHSLRTTCKSAIARRGDHPSGIYHSGVERIAVDLPEIPETSLWNLGRRAVAARTRRPLLEDPRAVEIVDRLDYDFADASRGAGWHAVRVVTFDTAIRRFLARYPSGTVVALGEGLETQFWRVDNGRMRWVSVDLPEALELRHKLLPEGPRQRSLAGSALETEWLDQLDRASPVLVSAQGLFMYFQREQVHELIAAMARRLADLVDLRRRAGEDARNGAEVARPGEQPGGPAVVVGVQP